MSILRTERLELCPLVVEDAAEMVQVLSDPSLYQFTRGTAPSEAELRIRYQRQVAGRSDDGKELWLNWIARLREGGHAVGTMQATVTSPGPARGDDHSARIAWVIGVPWQRRGLASEAAGAVITELRQLGVRFVMACIHPGHIASEQVAERVGMRPTLEAIDGERLWRCRLR